MPTMHRNSARIALSFGLALLYVDLTACSSSTSTTTTPPATALSLSAANTALQQKITTETPRVVNSSVVIGVLARPAYRAAPLPRDVAEVDLSTIWDPENGSPPINADFAVTNQYNGGNLTCDQESNTCTGNGQTVPELESLDDFMGQALDPNFENSNGASDTLFGRLQFTTQLLCSLGQLVPSDDIDTDGLPKVGSVTLSFPSDTGNILYQPTADGGCGVDTADAGQNATATVTAVTSADYDKQLSLAAGGNPHTLWLRLDSSTGVFNMMALEDQRPSGRYAADRTIVNISGLNTTAGAQVLFEYISLGSASSDSTSCYQNGRWLCSFEYHRVFIDEAGNQGYVVSNFGDSGAADGSTGAPTAYVQFTGAAQPSVLQTCEAGSTCSGTLAVSFTADGQVSPGGGIYPSVGNAYDGCINIDDRSIATDGSLACDVTGVSILASGGASAMVEATREVYASDVIATLYDNTTAATTLAFTGASDIYTAANTQ